MHNEILCSDNRRKLHKIYYTVRTVGTPVPTGLIVFVRKIDAVNYIKFLRAVRTVGDACPYNFER